MSDQPIPLFSLEEEAARLAKSGGWNGITKSRKLLTNAYLIEEDRVLLGYKKKGFGQGLFNGFGGKVESTDKSIYEAAIREVKEEAGIKLVDCKRVGVLFYDYPTKETSMEVHVFRATTYMGEIIETEEMKPSWVKKNDVNYNEMWADDPMWMPIIMKSDNNFIGWFNFSEDMKHVVKYQVVDFGGCCTN